MGRFEGENVVYYFVASESKNNIKVLQISLCSPVGMNWLLYALSLHMEDEMWGNSTQCN